ncbi:MAG: anti-sigma regulatory factor [Actinomycetota bacterium]
MSDEIRVRIGSEHDILAARQRGRELAVEGGFTGTDLTLIATAISEVARNIVEYAREGEIVLTLLINGTRRGMAVVASDRGPGIPDIAQAMLDGYSTSRSLGLGLPGARRLMDEFEIESGIGTGTTVTMRKWIHSSSPTPRR